jgi:6-pyruvoyltetrahydropterin/6-carboxytetrahydropterin synthase
LVNIDEIETKLAALVTRYRDRTLNDLPELAGLNPSVERVARAACEALAGMLDAPNLRAITVKLWEKPTAWAAYRLELSSDEPSEGVSS